MRYAPRGAHADRALIGGSESDAVTNSGLQVPAVPLFGFQMLNAIGDLFQIIPAVVKSARCGTVVMHARARANLPFPTPAPMVKRQPIFLLS